MIITENTKQGIHAKIVSKHDANISVGKVKWFNTETKEAEIYATLVLSINKEIHTNKVATTGDANIIVGKRKIVTFKCHLHDYIAIDKRTGKEIN